MSAFDSSNRLTGQRRQWGQSGTLPPSPSSAVSAMDATAQNASRLAITPGPDLTSSSGVLAELVVTSAVESGIWRRTFRVESFGVVIAVPEGRVTASLKNLTAIPFPWSSSFGEGVVSREWQCRFSGGLAAGIKENLEAPRYARRVRVAVATGGPVLIDLPSLGFGGGIVALLAGPTGGQTVYEIGAVPFLSVTNTGLVNTVVSVEWEIVG